MKVIVGVCREDDPEDVDAAYGAGTYARLFPYQCDCDDPDCPTCYPPAVDFEPADVPASGAAEPDDYFEREP